MIQRLRRTPPEVLFAALAAFNVALFVLAAALSVEGIGFPLDDSWIHQVYGRNLAQRGEWAFVPGVPSAASTSPAYSVLVAAGYVLGVDFFLWAFAWGAAALAWMGALGARLAARMFPDLHAAPLWTGLALVTSWHLVWAAASGMETALFAALSLGLVLLAWRALQKSADPRVPLRRAFREGLGLGLAGALLTLTRPEGVGLVGLVGAFALTAWPRDARRQYGAWALGVALGWGLGVAPYLALNWHIAGTWLPDTSAAKQAENAILRGQPLLTRYAKMLWPLVAGGQLLLVPGMVVGVGYVVRRARADRRAVLGLLPLAWALLDLSAYAWRLPAPYQHGRYVIPILPHAMLYGVGGTLLILRWGRRSVAGRVLSRSLTLTAVLVVPGFLAIGARQYALDVSIINSEMVQTAHWVHDNLPPDELLAVHDIGALGYYAPRPILDLAGLVSPEVVPIIRDGEALMHLMCARDVRYVMVLPDQRPAPEGDPRLELLYTTGSPYAVAAGSGNMSVYALRCP